MATSTSSRELLVTAALPYANGPIHLGHLVEYIQTDIWVRFQRLQGNNTYYMCASDAHGTPIMLAAKEAGISPEALVEKMNQEHHQDFKAFGVEFDNFYTTHSDENREFAESIYLKLKDNGFIETKTISQAFDVKENMFLPDRYVTGTCPSCKTEGQYGDNCEACGATYSPMDLIDPVSTVSGTTPEARDSEHMFFKLSACTEDAKQWLDDANINPNVRAKLNEWIESGLQDWCISRDEPYFGFKVPGTENKYFYVWLDAPMGYMASFKNYCDKNDINFDAYWNKDSKAEVYHFIGKDIINFHALFWPAVLKHSGYRQPTSVFAHGMLTVNGQKMSKSRKTFITAKSYLKFFKPDVLRYYYAAKLGPGIDDIDLSWDDFTSRVNSDLVGKFVNIASRSARILSKNFNNELADHLSHPKVHEKSLAKIDAIKAHYENREYGKAIREIMNIADLANRYIDEQKPWELLKLGNQDAQAQMVCTQSINDFRLIMGLLKPVLPELTTQAEAFLGETIDHWDQLKTPKLNQSINDYAPLLTRIEKTQVEKLMDDQAPVIQEPDYITIDDFAKVEMRVAKVLAAEEVAESRKLLRVTVDLNGEQRTIFAGIKKHYSPEQLIGKHVIVASNLAPRKMPFGVSEGMILAAGDDKQGLGLLTVDDAAPIGMRVS